MITPENKKFKLSVIGGMICLTLGIHYGLILEPIFGHVHWIHAIHGRFCYIPIVITAAWFGLRGGFIAAAIISAMVLPYIFGREMETHLLAGELVEIIFYFAIAILVGYLVDRQLLARLRQEKMRLQLERSHQLSMVGQIAAGVAHEVKNPLASIKGAVEIISDDDTLPAEKNEFREILFGEIKRMDSTISEFLAFARPRETILKRLDLSETIKTSIKQIETGAARSKVFIDGQIEDGIIVNGDQEKLHQMILNLLLNSLQASSPESSIEVTLSNEGSNGVRLVIKDQGEGINESDMDKIFEPFYTTRATGTGLGLAIVKAIIDDHEGTIAISSRSDRGTEIQISIPEYRES